MDQMGKRIKRKRENLGYSMKDLSEKIGVTSSLISQIEKGKAFPSIVTLKKIAEVLQTTVGELIGENENQIKHPVMRFADRRFAKNNNKGTRSYLLSYHFPSKEIEPYLIAFEKNSDSRGIMTSNYPGQEFCFVLKGEFEVTIEENKYILSKGDGFYFNSNRSHLFKNISGKEAELLWVITPDKL